MVFDEKHVIIQITVCLCVMHYFSLFFFFFEQFAHDVSVYGFIWIH